MGGWENGVLGYWGDGRMGEWVEGSWSVGRSLFEQSLVIGGKV